MYVEIGFRLIHGAIFILMYFEIIHIDNVACDIA